MFVSVNVWADVRAHLGVEDHDSRQRHNGTAQKETLGDQLLWRGMHGRKFHCIRVIQHLQHHGGQTIAWDQRVS